MKPKEKPSRRLNFGRLLVVSDLKDVCLSKCSKGLIWCVVGVEKGTVCMLFQETMQVLRPRGVDIVKKL